MRQPTSCSRYRIKLNIIETGAVFCATTPRLPT